MAEDDRHDAIMGQRSSASGEERTRAMRARRLLKEAAMLVRARRAVLESGDWLTAAHIATLAGLSTRNPSAQPNKWKKQGQIFAIHHGGVDYFPSYGLDPGTSFRPVKALARLITLFAGCKDGWGMATPSPPAVLHVTFTTLAIGLSLHRVHQCQYQADQFNPGVQGNARFSPIRDSRSLRCMAARHWRVP